MARAKVYNWTGWAPRGIDPPGKRRQVHCAVATATKKAFKELTNTTEAGMPWIHVNDIGRASVGSAVIQAAIAEPGTIFWEDRVDGETIIKPYGQEYK